MAQSTSASQNAALIEGFADIISTNYLGTASMALLLYDHLLTLSDEISYIWKRKKGLLGYLFLLNRYLTPLGFIVNMLAYLSPLFTAEVSVRLSLARHLTHPSNSCPHFVRYEGAFTTVSVAIAALMMIVRVRALYGGHRGVLALLLTIFLAQIAVQSWLLSGARAVPHTNGEHNCTMIFAADIGVWPSAYAWMPLIFDTTVLVLTVCRTQSIVRTGKAGSIVRTLFHDGILYYGVIFSANLVLAVMIVSAPDGIKGISAQFEQLITVTMISRITLNLKKNSLHEGDPYAASDYVSTVLVVRKPPRRHQGMESYELPAWRRAVDIEGKYSTFEQPSPVSGRALSDTTTVMSRT